METTAQLPAGPVKFGDKIRVGLACAVAVLLLWHVGWMVAEPVDPQMAVSLTVSGRSALAAGPALLLIVVVVAVIGTAVVGRRLPEGGMFAAAVGLSGLALRGGSMQDVLGYKGGLTAESRQKLMVLLWGDTLLWGVILAAAWIATTVAFRWLWARPAETEESADEARPKGPGTKKGLPPAKRRVGWPALAVTAVVGILIVWLTVSREPEAMIARGQVIASVGLGLLLGALAARYFTGIDDARWYVAAPLVVALIAYLMGYLGAGMVWTQGDGLKEKYAKLATTPAHDLVRILPVEYLAVGVAGALFGFWSGEKIEHVTEQESS